MRLARFLTQNVRQVLVAMIPFTFLGIQTLQYIMNNQPDSVENMGALITIWALINISISRTRYAESVAEWENAHIWQYLKHLESREQFRDISHELTFDLHASQIAQMSTVMGVPNPFCEPEQGALEEMAGNVESRMKDGDRLVAMQVANAKKVDDFRAAYKVQIAESKSWDSYLWKLEMALAIWGTLQGAFGAEIVNAIHSV